MDLWALQTSRLNPNPCPLPWVSDYKVIPASLSCGNWISLRDLWKLTSANAALLPATATLLTPPHPPKKNSWQSFQNINESTIRLKKRARLDSCICRLKSTSPVGARSWRRQAEPGTASTHRWGRLAGASLGARWPRCQQAGPGLIKDVEPNWSCQHLLRLHMGGWRRCSAQHRTRVTLRRDWGATYQKKGGGGTNGDKRNQKTFQRRRQMDRTLPECKYCRWTTVNLTSPLPFVLTRSLQSGLTVRLLSPRYGAAVYWAAIKSVAAV